jgi:heme-degrading monooxygenase HmoA
MLQLIFEACPAPGRWDQYLAMAAALRPALTQTEGFLDNLRYRCLTREGWLVSLSSWADEAAISRWRTFGPHRAAQAKGNTEVFADYRLRVGPLAGAGSAATAWLVEAKAEPGEAAEATAARLGLDVAAEGLASWDLFEAVLTPGDLLLIANWRAPSVAEPALPGGARLRRVAATRDYGKA